jgi:hypothetical protein
VDIPITDRENIINQAARNLVDAGVVSEKEIPMVVEEFGRLDPKDLIATLLETHILKEAMSTDIQIPLPKDMRAFRYN